jgi:hypothetical protein
VSRRTVKVIVPVSTFAAGVLAQLLAERLTSDLVNTSTRIVAATLGGVAFVVVLLIVLISFDYSDRVHQLNTISDTLEMLSRQFGLSVEFVADESGPDDGMSYERMRQLVSKAHRSVVFVDFWAEGPHPAGQEHVRLRRASYYDEIVRQIELRMHSHADGPPFHRRIVQVSRHLGPNSRLQLPGDDSFLDYISRCLALQELSPRTTVVKICSAQVHMHFAIIDDRYVILPILASNPRQGGVRRHGAVVFDDNVGKLVKELMNIYETLDAVAQPLEPRQIHRNEPPGRPGR